MKAKVIRVKVYEGVIAFAHGHSSYVKRLIVQLENGDHLAITPHEEQVHAFLGFTFPACEILGEVDLPDELVKKAIAFVQAKKDFDGLVNILESLINSSIQEVK